MIEVGDGFWNIRGSFKVMGVLDIGTQTSLVRLESGNFVLLDSYTLDEKMLRLVNSKIGSSSIEAIINLHPFHTVHVEAVAKTFPQAELYGTARHHQRFPGLPWKSELTEGPAFAERFQADFDFMVPAGVDFVPKNQNLHFASVLAFHRKSRTLHVDDTLMWVPIPLRAALSFHPTLGAVLERRVSAASDFRTWAKALVEKCKSVDRVCTAHLRIAPEGIDVAAQVEDALSKVEKTLAKHERKFS